MERKEYAVKRLCLRRIFCAATLMGARASSARFAKKNCYAGHGVNGLRQSDIILWTPQLLQHVSIKQSSIIHGRPWGGRAKKWSVVLL